LFREIFSWSTNGSFRMLLLGVIRVHGNFYETLGKLIFKYFTNPRPSN